MVIELCNCNHGIPGVESLPAHQHRDYARIKIIDPGHTNFGMIITLPLRDVRLNPDWEKKGRWEIVERVEDELLFSVNWKKVCRSLAGVVR